jgi:hypothetical protein
VGKRNPREEVEEVEHRSPMRRASDSRQPADPEAQTSSRRRKWDEPAGVWRSCQRPGQAPHLCSPLRACPS